MHFCFVFFFCEFFSKVGVFDDSMINDMGDVYMVFL